MAVDGAGDGGLFAFIVLSSDTAATWRTKDSQVYSLRFPALFSSVVNKNASHGFVTEAKSILVDAEACLVLGEASRVRREASVLKFLFRRSPKTPDDKTCSIIGCM